MKKLLITTIFFGLALNIFSQTVRHKDSLTSKEYLEKSKHQKTNARVLLGIGATAIVSGGLISVGNNDDLDGQLSTAFTGIPLMVVGGILSLISTSVFDASRKNEKRAEEAVTSIKFETIAPLTGGTIQPIKYTGSVCRNQRMATSAGND